MLYFAARLYFCQKKKPAYSGQKVQLSSKFATKVVTNAGYHEIHWKFLNKQ